MRPKSNSGITDADTFVQDCYDNLVRGDTGTSNPDPNSDPNPNPDSDTDTNSSSV
jgi:hypothetical protein